MFHCTLVYQNTVPNHLFAPHVHTKISHLPYAPEHGLALFLQHSSPMNSRFTALSHSTLDTHVHTPHFHTYHMFLNMALRFFQHSSPADSCFTALSRSALDTSTAPVLS